MIRFNCKNCGQRIKVPQIHAGKKGKCPKCSVVLTIPDLNLLDTKSGHLGDDSPTKSGIDLSMLDIPQKKTAVDEIMDVIDEHTIDTGQEEETPKRRFTWLIDIFLYPTNKSGLSMLGIFIGVPVLIDLIAELIKLAVVGVPALVPFLFFYVVAGWLFKLLLGLYVYWYFAECIRDSAYGGLRAPETMATTPTIGVIVLQLIKILVCLMFFAGPAAVYFYNTRRFDTAFYLLFGLGAFFFPMMLLSVVMFDSFYGFNPWIIIASIFSTFLPYCAFVLFFCGFTWFSLKVIMRLYMYGGILSFLINAFNIYILLVFAHLLGRFYYKYQEGLYWDV